MRIAVVGAGLSGLACAERLRSADQAVVLFDKGNRPGGRMSTRQMPTAAGEASFDHGAQYFTARDPGFLRQVGRWQRDGIAAPWPTAGSDAWVGTPAMDAPVRHMASQFEVRWSAEVKHLSRAAGKWRLHGDSTDEEPFGAVVVALPAEQAAPLLAPWDAHMAARAAATPSLPCWTAMAAFPARLPVGADVLRVQGTIGWAARNSAKPGRSGPESWVIQAASGWSRQHLEDDRDAVLSALLGALSECLCAELPEPLAAAAHRWRYSRSGSAGEGQLWNPGLGLGACGDWLLGPRVECAWLSGHRLADAATLARVPPSG